MGTTADNLLLHIAQRLSVASYILILYCSIRNEESLAVLLAWLLDPLQGSLLLLRSASAFVVALFVLV